MIIRRASISDKKRINDLLFQVAEIHANGRPDIFKPDTKKYSDEELTAIIQCDSSPIFVAVDDNGYVWGYAFCICKSIENNLLLKDKKTLYIDDLCVDEEARGRHIGKELYEHVVDFAEKNGFDEVTLNVWAFNKSAYAFYEKNGMVPQKIIMEINIKKQNK